MVRALVLGSACLWAVVGCGSGGGSNQAVSDCNAFVSSHYCTKVVACEPAGYITQQDCVSEVNGVGGLCGSVVSENGQIGACENQLDSESCTDFIDPDGTISLPTDCLSVFFRND